MGISVFISVILGLLAGILLFSRIRLWKEENAECMEIIELVSVIIPARNEEHNLDGILSDLQKQSYPCIEIICVDDDSTDNTNKIAKKYTKNVLKIENKPEGWMGKSYACEMGAKLAKGKTLIFLDADVRLTKYSIEKIVKIQKKENTVISIQPKHITQNWYEQLCLFFNIIGGIALTTKCSLGKQTVGLFGPVICTPKQAYEKAGRHESVKESILDDVSLGKQFAKVGITPKCYIGDETITFRMYPDGMKAMNQGWIKNFSSGAMSASIGLLLLIILWVSSLIRGPIELLSAIVSGNIPICIMYGILYILLIGILFGVAKKIGNFKIGTILLYPVPLIYFLIIFCISLYKKVFHRAVTWKGRKYR